MLKNNYSITWLPIGRESKLFGLSHCPGKNFNPRMRLNTLEKDGEFIKSNGVKVIVSLLTDQEIKNLGIKNFDSIWTQLDIEHIKFPIRDLSSPNKSQLSDFDGLIKTIVSYVHQYKPVLIHCNAGLGRSGLVAAVVCKELKIPNVIDFVRSYRKGTIETEEQEIFINNWESMTGFSQGL